MKTNFKIGVAAIGGLVLGAGLFGGIGSTLGVSYAQGTARYYEVADINVRDQVGYERSVAKVRDIITANGGRVIAGGYNKSQGLIGAPPSNRFIIFEFPNKAVFDKVWGESLRPWIDAEGTKYADFRAVDVEGTELK